MRGLILLFILALAAPSEASQFPGCYEFMPLLMADKGSSGGGNTKRDKLLASRQSANKRLARTQLAATGSRDLAENDPATIFFLRKPVLTPGDFISLGRVAISKLQTMELPYYFETSGVLKMGGQKLLLLLDEREENFLRTRDAMGNHYYLKITDAERVLTIEPNESPLTPPATLPRPKLPRNFELQAHLYDDRFWADLAANHTEETEERVTGTPSDYIRRRLMTFARSMRHVEMMETVSLSRKITVEDFTIWAKGLSRHAALDFPSGGALSSLQSVKATAVGGEKKSFFLNLGRRGEIPSRALQLVNRINAVGRNTELSEIAAIFREFFYIHPLNYYNENVGVFLLDFCLMKAGFSHTQQHRYPARDVFFRSPEETVHDIMNSVFGY